MKKLEAFQANQGVFYELHVGLDFSPVLFWRKLFGDSILAKAGALHCGLPASAASIERVWSAVSYQSLGREI